MSMKKLMLVNLVKNVAAAGSAEALHANAGTLAFDVMITAKSGNTNNIYVGPSAVNNTAEPIAAGETLTLTPPVAQDSREYAFDLNKIYIDADTNGEGVHVMYTVIDERVS